MKHNTAEESQILALYRRLLSSWNNQDAKAYAALFTEDASLIGFDGSLVNGRAAILQHIGDIFAQHTVASYVYIVKDIRSVSDGSYILTAEAGMVPPGGSTINAATNAMQLLVIVKAPGGFRITAFQNTPAAFHGRPELFEQLTAALQALVKDQLGPAT